MKTIITSILSLCTAGLVWGQGSITLSTSNSNVKYLVSNNGVFFHDPTQNSTGNGFGGYFVPKDSLVSSIFGITLMATGTDVNGQIKGAISTTLDSDFAPGPYLSNPANYPNSSYINKYLTSIWEVSKAQVDQHIAHWMDAGYVVPGPIAEWPGNGNSGNGESALLAPFYDRDGDQLYEPLDGDYPLIRGEKAVYTIVNDSRGVHASATDPIGIEVHMMFYQYDVPGNEALNNTVFVQTTAFNRGTVSLTGFHLGHYVDFDLGNPFDDYIGTDPARNLAYAYNGDFMDEPFSGKPGYGINPPATGFLTLDGTLNSNVILSGLSFMSTPLEFHNVLNGLLPDGSQMLDGNNQPTNYLYYDIDSLSGWNEFNGNGGISNAPGDRRSVTAQQAETFNPGAVLCYNHAAIFARSQAGTFLGSIDSLLQVADYIQDFYDDQHFSCEGKTLGLRELDDALDFSLFPNPSSSYLKINGLDSGTFRIISMDGKEVKSGNLENALIDVEQLRNGYYMIEITSGGKGGRKSFVKDGH